MKIILAIILTYEFYSVNSIPFTNFKSNGDNSKQRIIGGSDAVRYQFPYIVSIHFRGGHFCGGSILSPRWVVTAGHCCDKRFLINPLKFTIFAGLLNQGEDHLDVQNTSVVQYAVHPNYTYTTEELTHDIALLKLGTHLVFTEAVKSIKLPQPNQTFSSVGWLSGWGIYLRPSTMPETLKFLKMEILANQVCKHLLAKFDPDQQSKELLDSMVCTAPPTGLETACSGDSGGPIAQDGVLVGITSWAIIGCYEYHIGAPSVFTAVSHFTDFIGEYVKDIPF